MDKYLIINASFEDVREFLKNNFNSVTDVVAIGDFDSGVILCTDDNQIVSQFVENGYSPTDINNNVYAEMIVKGEDGSFTGHDLAIEGMKNARLR